MDQESSTCSSVVDNHTNEEYEVAHQLARLSLSESSNCSGIKFYNEEDESIRYTTFIDERQMPDIMRVIQKELSEPYSIYTYRYFIHNWPDLCYLVRET